MPLLEEEPNKLFSYSATQTPTSTPLAEEYYRPWESLVLPEERIDIQAIVSQYQTFFISELEKLRNRIDILEQQTNYQAKIIQVLQQKRIIAVQNLHSSKLTLLRPLYVNIEYGDGLYVASSEDLNLYGDGETELGAIRNLCNEIEDLYFDLKKNSKKLGKLMKENWNFLKIVIKELKK